nr:MAG TPA: hypothetical protein [Caudoviricetes sp.]
MGSRKRLAGVSNNLNLCGFQRSLIVFGWYFKDL